MKNMKNIVFLLHTLLIFICLNPFGKGFAQTFLQFIIILSWKLNNNQCILSQLENHYFDETLIEKYYTLKKSRCYYVPKLHRYTLYLIFAGRCCCYHSYLNR